MTNIQQLSLSLSLVILAAAGCTSEIGSDSMDDDMSHPDSGPGGFDYPDSGPGDPPLGTDAGGPVGEGSVQITGLEVNLVDYVDQASCAWPYSENGCATYQTSFRIQNTTSDALTRINRIVIGYGSYEATSWVEDCTAWDVNAGETSGEIAFNLDYAVPIGGGFSIPGLTGTCGDNGLSSGVGPIVFDGPLTIGLYEYGTLHATATAPIVDLTF